MRPQKHILAAAAFFTLLGVTTASATMPVNNLSGAKAETDSVENIRWGCGRYNCGWRSHYYRSYPSYGYYNSYAPAYSYGYAPTYSYGYAPSYAYSYGFGRRHYRRW